MLRFLRSILFLTSLGRAWRALSTVIPTSTRSLPMRCSNFGTGYPTKVVGREALMALYAGYGEGMTLHGADALVVNISQTPGGVILENEVQVNAGGSGNLYENRFISALSVEDEKIVGWLCHMDAGAATSS